MPISLYVPRHAPLSRRRLACALVAVTCSVGCAADSGTSAFDVSVVALESPAGDGSGESRLSAASDGLLLSWLEERPEAVPSFWIASVSIRKKS